MCTAQVTGPADRMELEHPAGVGLLTSRLSAILLDRQACGEVATTRTAWEDVKLFPRYLVESHRSPWSVDGDARRDGFCSSRGMFWGPRIVPPVGPRIG